MIERKQIEEELLDAMYRASKRNHESAPDHLEYWDKLKEKPVDLDPGADDPAE